MGRFSETTKNNRFSETTDFKNIRFQRNHICKNNRVQKTTNFKKQQIQKTTDFQKQQISITSYFHKQQIPKKSNRLKNNKFQKTTESTMSDTSPNTTNESYNSAQSKHSVTPTTPPQLQLPAHHPQPLPLRRNDITFLKEINDLNRSPEGKSAPVLSSIRPCYASSRDQDFFICNICHSFPKTGKWAEDTNEHPFVRNIGSIIRHIRMNHCNKPKENRQLTQAAERYILSLEENSRTRPVHPLFQTKTSIPKALSTSCINTAWKSNQTEITKKVVNTYYFSPNKCGGHKRLFSTKGPVYNYDIDESIYCTCKTKPLSRKKRDQKLDITPVCFHHGNSIQYNDDKLQMFFNCERSSIHQLHKTFLCNHTFLLDLPP